MSNWPCFSSMNGVHTLRESQGLGEVHTHVNSMPVVFMPMGGGGMSGAGIAWLVSSFRVFYFSLSSWTIFKFAIFKFVYYTCAFWLSLFRNSLSLTTLCVLSLPHIGAVLSFVSSSVGSQHHAKTPTRQRCFQNFHKWTSLRYCYSNRR